MVELPHQITFSKVIQPPNLIPHSVLLGLRTTPETNAYTRSLIKDYSTPLNSK